MKKVGEIIHGPNGQHLTIRWTEKPPSPGTSLFVPGHGPDRHAPLKNMLTVVIGLVALAGAVTPNGWLAWVAVIALVVLPPSWDPAIRFKEWVSRR